eukprot:5787346-Amphidinium_carterae.1
MAQELLVRALWHTAVPRTGAAAFLHRMHQVRAWIASRLRPCQWYPYSVLPKRMLEFLPWSQCKSRELAMVPSTAGVQRMRTRTSGFVDYVGDARRSHSTRTWALAVLPHEPARRLMNGRVHSDPKI